MAFQSQHSLRVSMCCLLIPISYRQYQTADTSQDPLQTSSIGITAADLTAEPESSDAVSGTAPVEVEDGLDEEVAEEDEGVASITKAGESDPLQASFNPTLTRGASVSREDLA